MNTLKKVAIGGVVIFVAVNVIWQLWVAKGFMAANRCLSEVAAKEEVVIRKLRQTKPGIERNKLVCEEGYESFSNLISCLGEVKKDYPISFKLYSSLPKFKEMIDNVVTDHNRACPEVTINLPKL